MSSAATALIAPEIEPKTEGLVFSERGETGGASSAHDKDPNTRYVIPLLCVATFSRSASADHVAKSEYLNHPEKNIDLVVQTAEFWRGARDDVNGGFYVYVDDDHLALLVERGVGQLGLVAVRRENAG